MLHHFRGIHSWENNKLFHKCKHGQPYQERKWIKTDSPSSLALKNVVESNEILAYIKYLNKFCHAGSLFTQEVFHSVLNKYCPKRLHLEGMIARTQLTVLHYNCGSNNTHATTKDGECRYKQIFSKVTQNWVVKKISETKDREYINELLSSKLEASPDTRGDKLPRIGSIPSNIAPTEKPEKEEAIENMKTRFKN